MLYAGTFLNICSIKNKETYHNKNKEQHICQEIVCNMDKGCNKVNTQKGHCPQTKFHFFVCFILHYIPNSKINSPNSKDN